MVLALLLLCTLSCPHGVPLRWGSNSVTWTPDPLGKPAIIGSKDWKPASWIGPPLLDTRNTLCPSLSTLDTQPSKLNLNPGQSNPRRYAGKREEEGEAFKLVQQLGRTATKRKAWQHRSQPKTGNKEQEQRLALNLQEQVGPFYVGDSAPLRRFAKDTKINRLLQRGRPKEAVWHPKADPSGADYAPGAEQQASRMANGNPTATLDCFPFEHLNVTSMLTLAPSTDGYLECRLALTLAHLLPRANRANLPWGEHQLYTTLAALRHAQQPHKEDTRACPSPILCQSGARAKPGPATTDQAARAPSYPLPIKDNAPTANTTCLCPYRLGLRHFNVGKRDRQQTKQWLENLVGRGCKVVYYNDKP